MSSVVSRYINIIRVQITALALGFGLTFASMIGMAVSQNHNNTQAQTEQAQVVERNEFYREIAGLQEGDSLDASDKLGIALNNRFEDVDTETEFDQVVEEFVASSRDYPGIVDQIGFNPFDSGGRSCNECGVLSSDMINKLHIIVIDGNVSSLITQVPVVDTTTTTTLFGMPVWLQLLLVWQIAGGIGLLYGVKKYGNRKLTFKRDGYADSYEYVIIALSPVAFAIYQFGYNRKMQLRLQKQDLSVIEAAGLLSPLAEINATLQAFAELPPAQIDGDTQTLMDALKEQRARILSYPEKLQDKTVADPSKNVLRENALSVLVAAQEAIDAHDAAVDEVSKLDHTN